jgi:hypothetical protein
MERGYNYRSQINKKGFTGTIKELVKETDKDFPLIKDGDTWGKWKLENNCIIYYDNYGNEQYGIALDKIKNNNFLGWIEQIYGKAWITPEDIWNFICAVKELKPTICAEARKLS